MSSSSFHETREEAENKVLQAAGDLLSCDDEDAATCPETKDP